MLGQDPRSGPDPVDAAHREDLGVLGLPHPACPLHPDQETHPHSGEDTVFVYLQTTFNTLMMHNCIGMNTGIQKNLQIWKIAVLNSTVTTLQS